MGDLLPLALLSALAAATSRYRAGLAAMGGRELLVSCSDDFTLFLWDPADTKRPVVRMVGHQQPVNHMQFSPGERMRLLASGVRGGTTRPPLPQTAASLRRRRLTRRSSCGTGERASSS